MWELKLRGAEVLWCRDIAPCLHLFALRGFHFICQGSLELRSTPNDCPSPFLRQWNLGWCLTFFISYPLKNHALVGSFYATWKVWGEFSFPRPSLMVFSPFELVIAIDRERRIEMIQQPTLCWRKIQRRLQRWSPLLLCFERGFDKHSPWIGNEFNIL